MTTRVLVTGASGFVGGHVCRGLLDRGGVEVHGTIRSEPAPSHLGSVISHKLNLVEPGTVRELVRTLEPDVVVHCAALASIAGCEADPELAWQVNTRSCEELADALDSEARLIHLSTDLVFRGDSAPYAPPALPDPLSVYGRTKAEGERAIMAATARHAVVRLPLVQGFALDGRSTSLASLVATIASGRRIGLFADEFRTPVLIEDVVRAIARLIDVQPSARILHLGGDERMSRLDIGRKVARALGASERLIVATRAEDSGDAHLRPRDVSLESRDSWRALGIDPPGFSERLAALVAG